MTSRFSTLTASALLLAISPSANRSPGCRVRPSATTTIPGDRLPAPPSTFSGQIDREATNSTPYWPPRIVPPKDAPDVLLIITDDAGYGVASTFGGVIPTPALDRIAAEGLRYANFHSTALCSPTRAAPITGRTTTRAATGALLSRRPVIRATTASSPRTRPRSAASCSTTATTRRGSARQKMEHTIPLLMARDESLDIGMDTRTPVDEGYKLPFRFTGSIDKLTYKIGHEQLAEQDRERMKRALAAAHD